MEVNVLIDDIRLRSNLTTNKTNRFTKKNFFLSTLGYKQSHSGVLSDIEGFVQLIPGKHDSNKPTFFTGIDKTHLKSDCVNGSIVNGVRE